MDLDDDFRVLDEPTFGVGELGDAIDEWDLDGRVRLESEVDRVRWADLKSEDWNGVPTVEGIGETLNTAESSEQRGFVTNGFDASTENGDLCDECRRDEIELWQMESEIDRLRQINAAHASQRYPSRTPPIREGSAQDQMKKRATSLERTKREQILADKERYRLELLDQINEHKSRTMAEEEWRRLDQSESDLEDANRQVRRRKTIPRRSKSARKGAVGRDAETADEGEASRGNQGGRPLLVGDPKSLRRQLQTPPRADSKKPSAPVSVSTVTLLNRVI
ncbi:hypothetical protein L596_015098 [Steinernema carpocapsae]|uniref:Uncharacterized protein n=1 Tax=Steinernema carpocapsae TaxID=34508 RepID=A0A4U5NEV5_STECR|nr:hypothetical protein L596_015098 [Steinernema carpocapsae]